MRLALAFPLLAFACSTSAPSTTTDAGTDLPPPQPDPPAVLTQHNDGARTGANLNETVLSPSTVPGHFGLLFSRKVRGYVYAQPLFVPALNVGGRTRDVVFVATEHNEVYAFDASDPSVNDPLWHVSFGPPVVSQHLDVYQGSPYLDIVPELGITSTPVIDLAAHSIFLFAQTEEAGVFANRLHVLDLLTGAEKQGSPIDVIVGPTEPVYILQRPGLALDRGTLYIAGGGHGDFGPYHGWVLAYDATTFALRSTYLTTPGGLWGGIWQSGNAPAIDEDGALYFMTGNGSFDTSTTPPNIGNAFGKIALGSSGLALTDWFAPFNEKQLDAEDGDLGSSGPMLIPGTKLITGGGKEGKLYVMDRAALGHQNATDDSQIVQSFQATFGTVQKHIHAGPVYWDGPSGPRVYVLSESDFIRGFRVANGKLETNASFVTTSRLPAGTPGGALSLSAHGKENGILWALTQSEPATDSVRGYLGPGALHAFDAENLGRELYSSLADPRVPSFQYVKFSVPTVTAGKVFVGTSSDQLLVFGAHR